MFRLGDKEMVPSKWGGKSSCTRGAKPNPRSHYPDHGWLRTREGETHCLQEALAVVSSWNSKLSRHHHTLRPQLSLAWKRFSRVVVRAEHSRTYSASDTARVPPVTRRSLSPCGDVNTYIPKIADGRAVHTTHQYLHCFRTCSCRLDGRGQKQ